MQQIKYIYIYIPAPERVANFKPFQKGVNSPSLRVLLAPRLGRCWYVYKYIIIIIVIVIVFIITITIIIDKVNIYIYIHR